MIHLEPGPKARGRCDHSLPRDVKGEKRKRCPEKAEWGYMLCKQHRMEGLARVRALQKVTA